MSLFFNRWNERNIYNPFLEWDIFIYVVKSWVLNKNNKKNFYFYFVLPFFSFRRTIKLNVHQLVALSRLNLFF